MSVLTFDTETTGLPDNRFPMNHESQPHICQLAAILTDDIGLVKAEMNFIVAPDGWEIPAAATAIHGISQEDAVQYGISIKAAISIFARMTIRADRLVAHNIKFDLKMLEIECARTGIAVNLPKDFTCTMDESTNIIKLPPSPKMVACGMTKCKSPNLQEAHQFFMGKPFEGAHDAMADVRACKDIYFTMLKTNQERIEQCKAQQ